MLAKLRSRLTFANVVASMALFVALSGGAYALTIPKNSVGAKQLKRNAVTRSKIKKRRGHLVEGQGQLAALEGLQGG